MSLRGYLQQLRLKVDARSLSTPFRVVTGNQSADMDSCVSAIVYSYYNHLYDNSFMVPLINIPKADFKLRRDIIKLLEAHSITEDLLYFHEDLVNLDSADAKFELSLVDHCNIQGTLLRDLYEAGRVDVVSIIDHHADEDVFTNAKPRIIHSNGSCSCLVFNYWRDVLREKALDLEVIAMLLGPLLIDTSNFTQKVEQGDIDAYNLYKQQLQNQDSVWIQKTESETNNSNPFTDFYQQLKAAKKDLSNFSLSDVLRKDYKQYKFASGEEVGFSSIGKSLSWIFSTYSGTIESTLSQFLKAHKLDMIIVTSSYTQKENDQYTREFCYYYQDTSNSKLSNLYNKVKEPLELNNNIYKIEKFKKKDLNTEGVLKVYNQANIRASRKQIVPIVKDALESQ